MKRFFDLFFSILGLVLLFPLMAVISLFILLIDGQSPLFRQVRITKGARKFTILKFQTVLASYDPNGKGVQLRGNSMAITPLGRFLRITKIDELPQLWNILKGDMSFVGPRPELPRRLEFYDQSDLGVWKLRAGVTSPASLVFIHEELIMNQVDDPETHYLEKIMPLKIKLNHYYLKRNTLCYDLILIFYTIVKPFVEVPLSVVVNDSALLREIEQYYREVSID